MNHQPFETWVLSGETLDADQHRQLEQHLGSCAHCRQLSAAWQSLLPMIYAVEPVAPTPGFTRRWQARLEREQVFVQRRQSWLIFSLSLGAATAFLLVLTLLVAFSYSTPLDWILGFVANLASLVTFTNAMQQVFAVLANLVPSVWLVSFAAVLAVMSTAWIAVLHKYTVSWRAVE
jgi:predicted anti-sigma-YlaC factor YlaD